MSSKKYLRAFDPTRGRCNDSGMTMLRIGSMNLMPHIIPLWDGIESPQVESLRGRMSEAGRQVEGLFESLLAEAFQ